MNRPSAKGGNNGNHFQMVWDLGPCVMQHGKLGCAGNLFLSVQFPILGQNLFGQRHLGSSSKHLETIVTTADQYILLFKLHREYHPLNKSK